MSTRSLTYSALMIVFIALCSMITIHLPTGVPITLQTLAIYLVGLLFERKQAFLICIVYLVMGMIGLPIFQAGSAGISYLLGPTGGFLIAFPFAALCISYFKQNVLSLIVGTLVIYGMGIGVFMFYTHYTFLQSIYACVIPFLIGDTIKIVISYGLSKQVKKNVPFFREKL